jgi:two-component system CheB/CheR fusion protein
MRRKPAPGALKPDRFPVAGVGASAGGFEAFTELLKALPARPGLAVVLVQHLAPHYDSALVELLTPHCKLPVTQVVQGVRVEANHIYIVPPNVQMEMVDDHLHLSPRPVDRTQYNPIDHFFRSLAGALKQRAIGVVLSGTASDGASGLAEIKRMGGVTLAQTPETAKYPGMPHAAIATRIVDLVLPPPELAAELVKIAAHPLLRPSTQEAADRRSTERVSEAQFNRVFETVLAATGVNFSYYKSATILRRLVRRAALLRMKDVASYIEYLETTPAEAVHLHDDFLIHVTRFFREPEAFDTLAAEFLPAVIRENAAAGTPIRAWVAGCATGEEAYSLAMFMLEALRPHPGGPRIQIFATDVSESAVHFARLGVYPPTIAADVSPERLQRFFTKTEGGYRIAKSVRELCVFARQDLTRDAPFSRLDLICCRNVLIYMDAALQKRLLSVFHYALKPTGVLLLGHAESIGHNSELFTVAHKKHRIHRKKTGVSSAAATLATSRPQTAEAPARRAPVEAGAGPRVVVGEAQRIVLDRYAPPSVLLDENFQIVQFNGQTGRYLEPSPGEPSFHVLKLAREGLLHGLRTTLQSAKKTGNPSRKAGLRVRNGSAWVELDLEVIPFTQSNQRFYLVLFEPPRSAPERKGTQRERTAANRAGTQGHRITRLEEELAATREYLQSTIQELEAANEELQSANEEILSSNEELQSTNEELDTAKEELQATNEELSTVNDELQGRNQDLTHANADLLNLLGSVQIAIVIVSTDLRIRRFTPMAEKVMNLIAGDVGRPLSQISPNIDLPELHALIADTIDNVAPIERKVHDRQGRAYLLRLRPYKSADNRIDGAVIALFDVDTPAT